MNIKKINSVNINATTDNEEEVTLQFDIKNNFEMHFTPHQYPLDGICIPDQTSLSYDYCKEKIATLKFNFAAYKMTIIDPHEDEEQLDKVMLSKIASKVASKMAGVKCPPDYNSGFCYPDFDCHSCWIGWLEEVTT